MKALNNPWRQNRRDPVISKREIDAADDYARRQWEAKNARDVEALIRFWNHRLPEKVA